MDRINFFQLNFVEGNVCHLSPSSVQLALESMIEREQTRFVRERKRSTTYASCIKKRQNDNLIK